MTAGPKHNAKKEKKKTSKKIEITSSQLNGDDDEPTATRIKTKYPQ
jgi:lipopolysaccharide export system protein LptA